MCVCVDLIELLSWNHELNLNLDDRQVVAWKIQSLDHNNYWNIFQIKNFLFVNDRTYRLVSGASYKLKSVAVH